MSEKKSVRTNRNNNRIRLLVVDDQKFVLEKLLKDLGSIHDFELIGTATNGADAFKIIETDQPDIALVDFEMPDMSGIDLTRRLRDRGLQTKIIIFSMHDEESYIRDAIEAGVRGYLLKTTPKEELVHSILFVERGYLQLGPGLYEKLENPVSNESSLLPLTVNRTQLPKGVEDSRNFILTEPISQEEQESPNTKRWSWKWALALLAASAALGITALTILPYLLPSGKSASVPVSTPSAPPPSISALGFIEPKGEVITLSAPAFFEGARVEQLLKQQGESVSKGEVVAILDSNARLKAAFEQAKQQVAVSQAELARVLAGAKQGDIDASSAQVNRVQAELSGQIQSQRSNIASLEAALAGDISTQEAVILENQADFDNASLECRRFEQLLAGGATSTSERDEVCLRRDTANQRLRQSKATLERIMKSQQEQINQAKANLQRTIDTLDFQANEALSSKDAVAEVRNVDVELAKQNLSAAEVAVTRAQADLDQSYVRSPIQGRVIKIHAWPGEIINQTDGIAELGQLDQMFVSAEVYETDVNKVKVGQKATIRADGVFEEMTGIVEKIGLEIGRPNVLGTDPVRDADVRVVEVKIRLSPPDSLKSQNLTNLQVKVIIGVDS